MPVEGKAQLARPFHLELGVFLLQITRRAPRGARENIRASSREARTIRSPGVTGLDSRRPLQPGLGVLVTDSVEKLNIAFR